MYKNKILNRSVIREQRNSPHSLQVSRQSVSPLAMRSPIVQAKLKVGAVSDHYEKDTTRVTKQTSEHIDQSTIYQKSNPMVYPHILQGNVNETQRLSSKEIHRLIRWYSRTRAGRRIKYTPGLVAELYKVAGSKYMNLYSAALREGEIGPNFIRLVIAAQKFLKTTLTDRDKSRFLTDGRIGLRTIRAWRNWKTGGKHGIDYRRLFKDGKLEIAIGIGYNCSYVCPDKDNKGCSLCKKDKEGDWIDSSFYDEYEEIVKLLKSYKFRKLGNKSEKSIIVYSLKKKYPVQGDRTATPIDIEILISLVSEKTKSPKEKFKSFLSQKEIVIYSGHARYGTGPDFDAKKSIKENLIIGVNSRLHRAGRLKKDIAVR